MSKDRGGPEAPAPRCSFCKEEQSNAVRMIKGPGVYICEECVNICKELLDGPRFRQAAPSFQVARLPTPKEIVDCRPFSEVSEGHFGALLHPTI